MSIIADTSATQIPSGTWAIDLVWSSLEFEVRKIGLVPIKGRVPGFSGTIEGGVQATIEGTVDAASVTAIKDVAKAGTDNAYGAGDGHPTSEVVIDSVTTG